MADSSAEFNEIKALIATIQPAQTPAHSPDEPALRWLAQSQGTDSPHLDHPRLCVFQASHGFAQALNLSQDFDYGKFIRDCLQGTSRLNRLALAANTDLRLYEMDAEDATASTETDAEAMTAADMVRSMAYGMMSVEPGLDLMAAAAFGHGSTISAQALIALHTGATPDDLSVARLTKAAQGAKGLEALARVGGYEIAALCGAIISARLANCPALLEGPQGYAAYLILAAENTALTDHCRLCGDTGSTEGQLDISTPVVTIREPGLNLACAIQQLRTLAILQDGVGVVASDKRSQVM